MVLLVHLSLPPGEGQQMALGSQSREHLPPEESAGHKLCGGWGLQMEVMGC